MITLSKGGAYLINGNEIVEDGSEALAAIKAKTGKQVSKDEALKETIAYGILKDHNTSGNMDKLKIKFDKLTSHDITFVGIIQSIGTREVSHSLCTYQLSQLALCSRR